MSGRLRRRALISRPIAAAVALAAILSAAGCQRNSEQLQLHFIPQFVPGSRNVLAPAPIAVAPLGEAANRKLRVGAIYSAAGVVQRELYVSGLGVLVATALVTALKDAAAKPVLLDTVPADGTPPPGIPLMLRSHLVRVKVDKRFGPIETVHGRIFTMNSELAIRVMLSDTAGRVVFASEVAGTEDEPPTPVDGEIFLPLETEPAESLSVALSRAIGHLMIDPKFASALKAQRR